MFTLSNLLCDYQNLLEDRISLELLYEQSSAEDTRLKHLLRNNGSYISHIEKLFRDHIPEKIADFDGFNYMQIANWFEFWAKYTNHCCEREEKLIALFLQIAELDFKDWEMYRNAVKQVCLCDAMVYFAATVLPDKKSEVEKLLFIIDKCASRGEADDFVNRVALRKIIL